VCPSLGIARESRADIDLGDPSLDARFAFQGPRSLLSAMMDHETRQDLLALAGMTACRPDSLTVADGTLRVDAWRPRYRSARTEMVRVAKRTLALAERLRATTDIPARLARNALDDPLRHVRLTSLRTLLREHVGEHVTRDALRRAAAHPDPELRLLAGQGLGEAGRPTLLDLARDAAIEDETSAGAIEALRNLSFADLEAVVRSSGPARLMPARPFTLRACADALAAHGAAAVPLLAEVVQSRNEAVGLAGVRALRQIGTVEAVLPLTQAAESGVEAVRKKARVALEDIQFGLKGIRGAVSLAGAEAGQVSVVEDRAGRVSLPPGGRAPERS
jgi:hypothetical protein